MISAVARKTFMAITGLFLCLFLVVHLFGNLQLFLPATEAELQFNWYASFLSKLTVIKIAAYVTFFSVVAHTVLAIVITLRNRDSAGDPYQDQSRFRLASWYSQMMGILGVVILLFLIVHLSDFWWPYTSKADIGVDESGRRNLFGLVEVEFQKGWKVLFYLVGVLAVGFHLLHGVYSGFRSLGIYHPGYAAIARWLGYGFAIVMTIGFGAMPIYIYFRY